MPKLTKAQAEILLILESGHWIDGPEMYPTFSPADVFTNDDNRSAGCKRTFKSMTALGYFKQSKRVYQTVPRDLYEADVQALRAAYQEWWKSEHFRDLSEIFPNGW